MKQLIFWSSMKCVICKKEIESKDFIPFCSSRCRVIDLGRWLDGSYVVQGTEGIGQDQEIGLTINCPDSSVGRAED